MPSLRTLLSDIAPADVGNPNRMFHVYNSSLGAQSGGCACTWTVPTGITRVSFEMWGAGGDGGGARCCESSGPGPTNGSYAIKHVDTVAGNQFRICAGGTGCEGCCCGIVPAAFPSYITDITNAGATIGCAPGGLGGCNQATRSNHGGHICCWGRESSTGLGDIVMSGTGNIGVKSCYCYQHTYMIVAGGYGADRMTSAICADSHTLWGGSIMTSCQSGYGGAGTMGRACAGGFCYGQTGGFGIVKVSYT